jgi:hypothetical protein
MSASDVFRVANSKAKFGAPVHARKLLANNCIHLAGRWRNDTGLMSTVWHPHRTGAQIPKINPIS